MKKILVPAILAALGGVAWSASAADAVWEAKRQAAIGRLGRFVHNTDGNEVLYWPNNRPVSVQAFTNARLKHETGTRITSVSYCPISAGFGYFTCRNVGDTLTNSVERFEQYPWTYTSHNAASEFFALGTDPLELAVDFCHSNNLGALVSIRINDQHDACSSLAKGYTTLFPPFKRAHPEFLMGNIDRTKNKHLFCSWCSWSCVDFTHKEVRERMKSFMRQFFEQYDIDGVEYDFNRHLILFKSVAEGGHASKEELDMMTDLMRDLRAMSEEIGRRRGRPIVVFMRAPDSVEYDRACGIDLERWFSEKLVDAWVGAGYFRLDTWEKSVELAHRHGIRFYASIDESRIERNARTTKQPFIPGRETRAAYAARFAEAAGAGVDGIYVFNLDGSELHSVAQMDGTDSEGEDKIYFARDRGMGGYRPDHWLKGGDSYDRLPPIDPALPPDKVRHYRPGETVTFPVTVGDDPAAARKATRIRATALTNLRDGETLSLSLNGKPLKASACRDGFSTYAIPAGALVKGANIFSATFPTRAGDYRLKDFAVSISYSRYAAFLPLERASCGVFSPDGKSIAFQQEHDGRLAVGVMRLDTGTIEWIEKGAGQAFHPAWTPDGGLVYSCGTITRTSFQARAEKSQEGYNLRLWKNGVKRDLTRGRWRDSTPSVSPDGRTVWFASTRGVSGNSVAEQSNSYIYSCPVEGGEPVLRRTTPGERPGGGVSQPVQSPDGKLLVWAESAACGDIWSIFLARADQPERACRITPPMMPAYAPRWSPDGRTVVFTGWREGDSCWSVYVTDVRAATIRRVCPGREASFSPDGRLLVYENVHGALDIRPFDVSDRPNESFASDAKDVEIQPERVLWSADNPAMGGEPRPLPAGFDTAAGTVFVRARISAGNRKVGFEHLFTGRFKEHPCALQLYFDDKGMPWWATRFANGMYAGVQGRQLPEDFEGTVTGIRQGDRCYLLVEGQPLLVNAHSDGLIDCLKPVNFSLGPPGTEGFGSRPFKGRVHRIELGTGWPANVPAPPTRKEMFK